jgi:hypothetical protein
MVRKISILIGGFVFTALIAALIGCSKGPSADAMFAENSDINIKRLAWLYGVFQVNHNWNGPKDEAEFRKFIESQNPKRLSKIGIEMSSLENLFVSERDNQPFKIRWQVLGSPRGPEKPVIFEAAGVDGKFQIGFTGNKLVEVEQSEYDRLWSGESDDVAASDGRQNVGQ